MTMKMGMKMGKWMREKNGMIVLSFSLDCDLGLV